MKIDPNDYNIPEGFRHYGGDPAEDSLGPFFGRIVENGFETAFRAQAKHCNGHNTVHGGILMIFADYSLCMAGIDGEEGVSVITISCNNEFILPALEGDLILGRCEVLRQGRSLIFVRCTLSVNGNHVLNSSGVVKRIPKPA